METTAPSSSGSELLHGPESTESRLRKGAIASPMAVSFREEKLALGGASSPVGQPDGPLISGALWERR